MTALIDFLDEIDQRRQRAEPTTLRCPCCGERQDREQFDEAGVLWNAEHMAKMRCEFGDLVCDDCANSHADCEHCGRVYDKNELDEGYCAECVSRFNLFHGRRPIGGGE